MQESILAVVNALAGKKNLTAVDHAKMTEDVLFASFVHDKLQKALPALAKSLLKLLKGKFDKHTKAKESQPLFRSIEEILKEGVSSKKLTTAKMDEILKSSFGQAQLDGTAGRLSRRARGDGLEGVLDRVAKNGVATQKQVDSFEKRIETLPHLKAASSTSQRRELTKVFNSMTGEKTDSTPGTGGSTNPGTGPVTGTPETDKPKPLPKPEDRPTDLRSGLQTSIRAGWKATLYDLTNTGIGRTLWMSTIRPTSLLRHFDTLGEEMMGDHISDPIVQGTIRQRFYGAYSTH